MSWTCSILLEKATGDQREGDEQDEEEQSTRQHGREAIVTAASWRWWLEP